MTQPHFSLFPRILSVAFPSSGDTGNRAPVAYTPIHASSEHDALRPVELYRVAVESPSDKPFGTGEPPIFDARRTLLALDRSGDSDQLARDNYVQTLTKRDCITYKTHTVVLPCRLACGWFVACERKCLRFVCPSVLLAQSRITFKRRVRARASLFRLPCACIFF